MSSMYQISSDILNVCQRLYQKGFVAATDGNVSARLDSHRIICTPSGLNKGDLTRDDLVVIDLSGKPVERTVHRPSSEIQMHLQYYASRPDVQSVVHAHAPYCTAFATSGQGLTGCVLPEIVVSIGSVPLARYATPSTAEVPDSILPFVDKHNVILLQNHGVVAAGTSLWDAYYKLEKSEHAAQILFLSRLLGGEQRLSQSQVNRLKQIAGENYGISSNSIPSCESADVTQARTSAWTPQSITEVKDSILRAINELGL